MNLVVKRNENNEPNSLAHPRSFYDFSDQNAAPGSINTLHKGNVANVSHRKVRVYFPSAATCKS